jgi:hypothetical protein
MQNLVRWPKPLEKVPTPHYHKKREPSTLMALTIQLCFLNKIKLGCNDGKTYK